ncbi:pleckstrin homology domain-containing family G member 7 isoform X10 [Hydra vulgaris]|uniref:Pleckstrin homology domain-containing family G member 7 isoform X10 n=2 Tax=Hydra vulgaris TaxID=6087 RepID=A0ABM4D0X9_HYDVU
MKIINNAMENSAQGLISEIEFGGNHSACETTSDNSTTLAKPLIWDGSGNILFNEDHKALCRSPSNRSIQSIPGNENPPARDVRFQRSLFARKKSSSFCAHDLNKESMSKKYDSRNRSKSGNLPEQKSDESMSKLKHQNSFDEGETDEDAKVRKEALLSRDRMRNSTVVQIPSASIQMDLHTLYLDKINQQNKGIPGSPKLRSQTIFIDEENQKKNGGKFALIKQKLKREDSLTGNNEVDDFKGLLAHIRSNLCEASEHDLSVYKGSHWSTVNSGNVINSNDGVDNERFEALWELFYAEITYLMDHLIVLNDVFAKQLQHAKGFGFLTEVNESTLFANLDSLIEATSEFAKRLIKIFQDCQSVLTASTKNIVEAFREFDKLLTPQYNEYCLNYQRAKTHLENLKRSEMFLTFLKWCEQDNRCQRLRLEDFLVAPLQHLTKYPLLLKAIRKRTPNHDKHTFLLSTTIINIENSIKSIEKKYSALVNLQRIQEIHESLAWPVIVDPDKTCFLPESVKNVIASSHCENILMNPNRVLIQEGILTLADNNKTEFYTFLFDDMLMFTKFRKKNKRRSGSASDEIKSFDMSRRRFPTWEPTSAQYTVYKQPIPLDRLRLYNCDEQSLPVKNAFCVLHYNRYHQPVSAYTLISPSPEEKKNWMKNIEMASDKVNLEISNTAKEHSSDEEYML